MGDATRGYERDAERLCAELARLNLGYWSGREHPTDPVAIYARHRRLLSRRVANRLARLASGDDGRARRARDLLAFAAESRVNRALLGHGRALARIAVESVVSGSRPAVPLASVREAVAAERDPDRRRELLRARSRLLAARVDPLLIEAWRARRRELATLGFASERDLLERLGGIDVGALASAARDLLDRSGDSLRSLLDAASGVPSGAGEPVAAPADHGDLVRLQRLLSMRARHQAGELGPIHDRTLRALGIDPTAGGRIRLDLDPRPGKSPRAFCSPVGVPGEVHLVVRPSGGLEDLATLLHEAGHAQHFAGTDPSLGGCDRLLGDRSVGEAWAFLFEGLAAERGWLEAADEVGDPVSAALTGRLRSLVTLRRQAALLLFQLELDAHGAEPEPDGMRRRYAELQTGALGVEVDGAAWLYDLDPGLYPVWYLRGWALAAGLRARLRREFGEHWFREPGAGAWLRRAWARGQQLDADALGLELTGGRPDLRSLETEPLGTAPGRVLFSPG
jgi:hypothetical protein